MMDSDPDQAAVSASQKARRRAMGAFALATRSFLLERYASIEEAAPAAAAVRGPQVGLVTLRGRAGGGGAPFNLGEASVARASVKLPSGEIGHAVILGRDAEKARIVAHLDALWQRPDWRKRIEDVFVAPALAIEAEQASGRAEETEATRVNFFTLARGED